MSQDINIKKSWGCQSLDESAPFLRDGQIYRKIPSQNHGARDAILNGTTTYCASLGLLPQHTLTDDKEYIVVDYIPWCVFAALYCKLQVRDGLINTLKLIKELKPKGFDLFDFYYQQIGMKYSEEPIFIDFGSIHSPANVYPKKKELLAWCKVIGMEPDDLALDALLEQVKKHVPVEKKNMWDNYDKGGDVITDEQRFIVETLRKHGVNNVCDVGANKGRLAKRIVDGVGIPVLAVESAGNCVQQLYVEAKSNDLPITALHWDIMQRPKWHGYMPMKCEGLVASSITHHLARAKHTLTEQAQVFSSIGTKLLLVEYIDPKDEAISGWSDRERGWDVGQLEDAFQALTWEVVDKYSPELKTRTWYVFAKRE